MRLNPTYKPPNSNCQSPISNIKNLKSKISHAISNAGQKIPSSRYQQQPPPFALSQQLLKHYEETDREISSQKLEGLENLRY
jgi:hypothetical protein